MNADENRPDLEPASETEVEETPLLRKAFLHSKSPSSSSSDSDDMYSDDFQKPKSVVFDEQQGTEFSNGSSGLKNGGKNHVIYEVWPVDENEDVPIRKSDMQNGTAIKHQNDQIPLPVSNGAIEEQNSHYPSLNDGNIENERVEFRTENGNEVADLYLERIYEKPRSHDFYCPHCQACITKVIIRDRELVNTTTTSVPVPTRDDNFRCTSCFSFLIPIGAWIFPKLASPEEQVASEQGNNIENIRIRERDTLQVLQVTRPHQESQDNTPPVPIKSGSSALVDKNKGYLPMLHPHPSFKEVTAEGRTVQEKTGDVNEKVWIPDKSVGSAIADQMVTNLVPTPPSLHGEIVEEEVALDNPVSSIEGFENIVVGIPYQSHESNGSVLDKDSQASSVNKGQISNQSNGFAVLLESEKETKANSRPSPTSLEVIRAETLVDSTLDGKKDVDVGNSVLEIPYPSHSQQPKGGLLNRFYPSSWRRKTLVPDQPAGVAKTEIPKTPELIVTTGPDSSPDHTSIGAATSENVLGSEVNRNEGPVVISIDDSVEGRIDLDPMWSKRWDILRCLVYGGLAESITSLGIVSSAASADATTGNIVALALANLISGLFIIGHNLAALKSEQFRRASDETGDVHVDRYEVVLGNRDNYILHFTMAFLSFLVFGLVPPLVYGFSFPGSDDKDFKLVAAAGASLLCIILLALAKAHIQKPNKWDVYLNTVVTYVVIGAGAGGLSYLAGNLIDRLIKKYGWFEPSPAVNLLLPEMGLAKPAWASY